MSKKIAHFLHPDDGVEEDEFTRVMGYGIENKASDIAFDEPPARKAVFPSEDKKKSEAIIDEAIVTFDALIDKVHTKNVENKKAHFKGLQAELISSANTLLAKVNKM